MFTSPATPRSTAMTSTLRCFRVLELLAEHPFELGISELAAQLSLPKSSIHRLCTTLMEAGFVEHDAAGRRYRLSPRALWVGSGYLRHSAVYRAAFFPMQDLARQLPGTVQLAVPEDGWVLFLHSVGYAGTAESFADVGLRRALHATASGKLFLADLSRGEVDRIMANARRYTGKTILSAAALREELARIGQLGYAVNNEELLPGFVVLAAPVKGPDGRTIAALSVTLPVSALDAVREQEYATLLRTAAHRTSLQVGFGPAAR